jgi:hypothetical protein
MKRTILIVSVTSELPDQSNLPATRALELQVHYSRHNRYGLTSRAGQKSLKIDRRTTTASPTQLPHDSTSHSLDARLPHAR